MSPVTCPPLAHLIGYWLGDPDGDALALEEHIFECAGCAGRLESIVRVDAGVADLVRRGRVRAVIPATLVAELEKNGLRLRHYRLAPGERVPCGIGPDDDFVVTQLEADFHGVERVDLVRTGPGFQERLADVPIDRVAGRVIVASSGDAIRRLPDLVVELRLVDTTGGAEHTLGEYTLVHSAARG